jgi:hypothetical protein
LPKKVEKKSVSDLIKERKIFEEKEEKIKEFIRKEEKIREKEQIINELANKILEEKKIM